MELWIAGGIAFLVTCASAPLVRWLLVRLDVVDRPNGRSSHSVATPRGGGMACALGLIAGALVSASADQTVPWDVLAAALFLGGVGFLDDRFRLPAAPRLVAQLCVGAALGASIGGLPWGMIGALTVPLIVNVVNFMDGINGITGLTLGAWGVSAALAGVAYQSPGLAMLGGLTVGSAVGFLPWNFLNAKLFLGDLGSYLFGALAAGGVLLGSVEAVPVAILIAPLAVYLADVGVAIIRRGTRGAPLAEAHREHVYQQMVDHLQMPHAVVAAWATAVAIAISLAWSSASGLIATALTALLLGIFFVCLPVLRRMRVVKELATAEVKA